MISIPNIQSNDSSNDAKVPYTTREVFALDGRTDAPLLHGGSLVRAFLPEVGSHVTGLSTTHTCDPNLFAGEAGRDPRSGSMHPKKMALGDHHGRIVDYLRISVTDRCNLKCIYCGPSGKFDRVPANQLLTDAELVRVAKVSSLLGIKKIRITGGDPLLCPDICGLVRSLADIPGIEDIGMTTNGIFLGDFASKLRDAGLKRANISLDSLRPDAYSAITRGGNLDKVLFGIDRAVAEGLTPVKLNVVLLKNVNEQDLADIASMSLYHPIHVRFCEQMPCGKEVSPRTALTGTEALSIVKEQLGKFTPIPVQPGQGPAQMYQLHGAVGTIGVITGMTGHFCASCNRLRLTAKGTLRPCLFDSAEFQIRDLLRSGANDGELAKAITHAVSVKPLSRRRQVPFVESTMNVLGG
jgi:cyclic pyranopterin phosphate synthase